MSAGKGLDIGTCQDDTSNVNANYSVGKPNASANSRREQRRGTSEPSEVLGDSHERHHHPDHDQGDPPRRSAHRFPPFCFRLDIFRVLLFLLVKPTGQLPFE